MCRGRRGGPWTLPACRRPVSAPPACSAPAPFQPARAPLVRSAPRSASHFKWVHLDLMPKPLEDPCFRRPGGLWPGGTSRGEPAMREQIEVAPALTSVGQKHGGHVPRRLVCCTSEGLWCDTEKPRVPTAHVQSRSRASSSPVRQLTPGSPGSTSQTPESLLLPLEAWEGGCPGSPPVPHLRIPTTITTSQYQHPGLPAQDHLSGLPPGVIPQV